METPGLHPTPRAGESTLGLRGAGGSASLLLSAGPLAEEETHPVDLSSLYSKLLPGFTTLGFKEERRGKGEWRRWWSASGHVARLFLPRGLPGSLFSAVSRLWL